MVSKPKSKIIYVRHMGLTKDKGCTTLGSYMVGARNEDEAKRFVKDKVAKHLKLSAFIKKEEDLVIYKLPKINYGDVYKRVGGIDEWEQII